MELRYLRYFVAVAEEKSFTKAAARLGIKQPPLSLQIRKLEKEMGARLFYRGTRSVELTDSGRLLFEETRLILAQVERTKTDVRRRARGETGALNVGFVVGTQFHPLVPTIIREYGSRFPEVIMRPQAASSALHNARVRAGTVDLAFVHCPTTGADGLTLDIIVEEPVVAVLPIGHRLSRAASLHLSALADEKLVLFARDLNPVMYDAFISAIKRAGLTPRIGQHASVSVGAPPMVAAGLGWSLLPASLGRILPHDVAYVPIADEMPTVGIGLVHRPNDPSAAVQNFVAIAKRMAGQRMAGRVLERA